MRLHEGTAVNDLVAVDLEPAQDLTEGQFRAQRFHLADLRGERQAVRMAGEDRPLTRVELGAVVAVVRQQVADVDGEPVHHAEAPVAEHRNAVAGQISLSEFRLLDLAASPRRHHDPSADFRNVLLVQDLAHTHEHVQEFDLAHTRVTANHGQGSALDAEVDRAGDDARGGALVGGRHLTDDAREHVLVNDDLQLLGSVVRPHREDVQVGLDLHHVIEDQREVFAVPDVQLDSAAGGAVEGQQAIAVIVADGDRGLRADFHPVALVFDFALIVRVADRSKDRGGIELLD